MAVLIAYAAWCRRTPDGALDTLDLVTAYREPITQASAWYTVRDFLLAINLK